MIVCTRGRWCFNLRPLQVCGLRVLRRGRWLEGRPRHIVLLGIRRSWKFGVGRQKRQTRACGSDGTGVHVRAPFFVRFHARFLCRKEVISKGRAELQQLRALGVRKGSKVVCTYPIQSSMRILVHDFSSSLIFILSQADCTPKKAEQKGLTRCASPLQAPCTPSVLLLFRNLSSLSFFP
jgi:hypothetical protein